MLSLLYLLLLVSVEYCAEQRFCYRGFVNWVHLNNCNDQNVSRHQGKPSQTRFSRCCRWSTWPPSKGAHHSSEPCGKCKCTIAQFKFTEIPYQWIAALFFSAALFLPSITYILPHSRSPYLPHRLLIPATKFWKSTFSWNAVGRSSRPYVNFTYSMWCAPVSRRCLMRRIVTCFS